MAGRKQDSCGVRNEETKRVRCSVTAGSPVKHMIFKLLLSVALAKGFLWELVWYDRLFRGSFVLSTLKVF